MTMKLGDLLVKHKIITKKQLDETLAEQARIGEGRLGFHLVRMGVLSERKLLTFLGRQYRLPIIDLSKVEIHPNVIKLIPSDVAVKYQAIPVKRVGRKLTVAIANPLDMFALDDIKFVTAMDVEPAVGAESAIKKAIDKYYEQADSLADIMRLAEEDQDDIEVVKDEDNFDDEKIKIESEEAPVVKLVNSVIADAARQGASDIHIEPYERSFRLRFRIDGTLYEQPPPPMKLRDAITSRVKIMSQLDISERRVPQDGRIKIKISKKKTIDLRVSTLPIQFGEKIVMRILDQSNLLKLEQLGFPALSEQRFLRAINNPYGMVLVTGPTGSGKTVTLYSAISRINVPSTNIMTAEDPVEYNFAGINQVLIKEEQGMTFSKALKAFLRQDPNIILVGEIRDYETGSIAIKAAITGHLVLSTLHTNDTAMTISRLVDMGIEPFLVSTAVNLIQAQRLVRRVCKHCKRPIKIQREQLEQMSLTPEDVKGQKFVGGKGCSECKETGCKGRIGLYEVMEFSPTLKQMVLDRAGAMEVKRQAIREGMLTLRMDGVEKWRNGIIPWQEVIKESSPDRGLEDVIKEARDKGLFELKEEKQTPKRKKKS
ncbi:MAG: type IV-A pilus assembly ATPase PilB [Candidatus Cloacimonetes bacterium 4572_55]|nr:MAG: type IV-A pilus assembly ATPase PilB [Candidatus Cloacimonetes bacterium 4572_55]